MKTYSRLLSAAVVIGAIRVEYNAPFNILRVYYKDCLEIQSTPLSRNRRDPLKHFKVSVLRHIRFVVSRKKFEQPNFTYDYVI